MSKSCGNTRRLAIHWGQMRVGASLRLVFGIALAAVLMPVPASSSSAATCPLLSTTEFRLVVRAGPPSVYSLSQAVCRAVGSTTIRASALAESHRATSVERT